MHELVITSIAILGIPLLSFVLIIFNQKALRTRAHLVGVPLMTFGLLLAIYTAFLKLKGIPTAAIEYNFEWINFGDVPGIGPLVIKLGVMVDNLTAIMLVVVMLVSALVHLFSSQYMRGDVRYARYYAYLGIFTFSMIGIVITNTLFGMYIFWELVGFSSYSLISHWYEKPAPQNAAKKAFLVNRVGDIAMWTGLMTIFATLHTFTFSEIFDALSHGLPAGFTILGLSPADTLSVAGVLIFCGAIGKSAQFPLHVWLPDAMEGPTPVSALIHAATMVAAGVYLTARIFPIITADASLVIACVGAITAFIGATIAITQSDIKRVLAYSTVSQLGYMIMALGAGAFTAGFFHLVTHAMFKACLFLGSGSVIHAMHHSLHHLHDHHTDPQDMRNMGGLIKKMPVTAYTFIIATLALSGIPLFSGFMSKDEILAGVSAYGGLRGDIAMALPYIGFTVAFLTALYMGKLVMTVFFGEPKVLRIYEHIKESPKAMLAPLAILAVLSLWFWYGINPVNPAKGWFMAKWVQTPGQVIPEVAAPRYAVAQHDAHAAEITTHAPASLEAELQAITPEERQVTTVSAPLMPHQHALEARTHEVALTNMIISVCVALAGLFLSWFLYLKNPKVADALEAGLRPLHTLSRRKYFFDEIYDFMFVDSMLLLARAMAWFDQNVIDRIVNATASITVVASNAGGWFDKYIVDGLVNLTAGITQFFGLLFRTIQTGRIQSYLGWTLASVVIMILLVRYFFVGV